MVHTNLLVRGDDVEVSAPVTVAAPAEADIFLVQRGAVEAADIVDAGLGLLGRVPDVSDLIAPVISLPGAKPHPLGRYERTGVGPVNNVLDREVRHCL